MDSYCFTFYLEVYYSFTGTWLEMAFQMNNKKGNKLSNKTDCHDKKLKIKSTFKKEIYFFPYNTKKISLFLLTSSKSYYTSVLPKVTSQSGTSTMHYEQIINLSINK